MRCSAKEGEPRGWARVASRWEQCPSQQGCSPTLPEQEEQSRSGDSNQVQPKVHWWPDNSADTWQVQGQPRETSQEGKTRISKVQGQASHTCNIVQAGTDSKAWAETQLLSQWVECAWVKMRIPVPSEVCHSSFSWPSCLQSSLIQHHTIAPHHSCLWTEAAIAWEMGKGFQRRLTEKEGYRLIKATRACGLTEGPDSSLVKMFCKDFLAMHFQFKMEYPSHISYSPCYIRCSQARTH